MANEPVVDESGMTQFIKAPAGGAGAPAGGTSSTQSGDPTFDPTGALIGSGELSIRWQGQMLSEIEVQQELAIIEANDSERFYQLEQLAEDNGYSSINSAIMLAHSDNQKESRDSLKFLRDRSKNPAVIKEVADGKAGSGGGAFSNTSTSISLSDESQSGRILDANFDEQMGRTASASEIQDFQKVLNEQQRANPSTTTQQGFTSGRNTTSTSTSTTQFDPTRFAREYASQQDGADERYAGQTFMDILDLAISKPNAISEMLGSVNG